MEAPIPYPVCPHRNVAGAFERFFGPDSHGIDRFFDNAIERDRFCFNRLGLQTLAALAVACAAATVLLFVGLLKWSAGYLGARAQRAIYTAAALSRAAFREAPSVSVAVLVYWVECEMKGPALGGALVPELSGGALGAPVPSAASAAAEPALTGPVSRQVAGNPCAAAGVPAALAGSPSI